MVAYVYSLQISPPRTLLLGRSGLALSWSLFETAPRRVFPISSGLIPFSTSGPFPRSLPADRSLVGQHSSQGDDSWADDGWTDDS